MADNLLIVESPAKAKTIEKYLGKNFKVKSSYGHIRDLEKGNKGIDIENHFEPSYVVSPEKKKVVAELKKATKAAKEVWLATDEDREGEAISWHLCEVLGLDPKKTKRIVFREITEPAVKRAIEVPRTVDLNLVDAQQARRVLDRLVGFELSGILWRKVKNKLSAGRVQSVAVKILVEREREIMNFIPQEFFKIKAVFNVKDHNGRVAELKAELPKKLETEAEARTYVEQSLSADFNIQDIKVKPGKRRPAAPFTTSTLQQEASRKLGFSVSRTMQNAQRLYEQGHITYMRTDSTSLSELAISSIKEEIISRYGEKYSHARRYKKKSKVQAQEAHEAIRPSNANNTDVTNDRDQQRLYELIWKRTVASQMSDAELEKTTVTIGITAQSGENPAPLRAEGEVLVFDGFLKVYLEGKDDDDEEAKGVLPPLSVGQNLDLKHMDAKQSYSKAPPRYTEASLVKALEEKGVGRPSTYAPTITRIMDPSRGYVIKETREPNQREILRIFLENNAIENIKEMENYGAISNRLVPTDLGMLVCDFLDKHFTDVMSYDFTASIEDKFDNIADGEESWKDMIKNFYGPFHETVEDTLENADRASGERILGKDPKSGRTLLVRMARFGPVAQIGNQEELAEDEKPQYANLRRGQSMETISFEEAIDLFKLPRTVGQYKGEEVIVNVGRFGPYVKFGEKYVNIGRDKDPLELSWEEAEELIKQKEQEDAPVMTFKGEPVTKGKGRFGPFLKYAGMFVNIPRRYDPETISEADMTELIEKKIEKEANRYIQRFPEYSLDVENGRWGPFIRVTKGRKKTSIKIPKDKDGNRMTPEQAKELTIEQILALVLDAEPTLHKAITAPAKKKTTRKKAAPKKGKSPGKK